MKWDRQTVQRILLRNHLRPPKLVQLYVSRLVFNIIGIKSKKFVIRRYELILPEDNTYGKEMPNGSWNGMIGMVIDN